MTEPTPPEQPATVTPSRHDRLRPAELLGFAGVLAVFAGLIVLMVSRDFMRTGIGAVVVFIVALVVLALLGLGGKPSAEDAEARKSLRHPGSDSAH